MNYCPNCNNLLVPRGENFECRICNREFSITENEEKEYKVVKPVGESKEGGEDEDVKEKISNKEGKKYKEQIETVNE